MNCDDAKLTIRELQSSIRKLVQEFEDTTEMRIEDIVIYRSASVPKVLDDGSFRMQMSPPSVFVKVMVE